MSIPPAFLPYLEEMRALARDGEGRLCLVGLSFDETGEYFKFSDDRVNDSFSDAASRHVAQTRYLELDEKHELQRKRVLFAEIEARTAGPKH